MTTNFPTNDFTVFLTVYPITDSRIIIVEVTSKRTMFGQFAWTHMSQTFGPSSLDATLLRCPLAPPTHRGDIVADDPF